MSTASSIVNGRREFGRRTSLPIPNAPAPSARAADIAAKASQFRGVVLPACTALSAAVYALLYWFYVYKIPVAQPAPPIFESGPETYKVWAPFWIAPLAAALVALVADALLGYLPWIGKRSWGFVRELVRAIIGAFAAGTVYSIVELQLLASSEGMDAGAIGLIAAPAVLAQAFNGMRNGLLAMLWLPFLIGAIAQLRWVIARLIGEAPEVMRTQAATYALRVTTAIVSLCFAAVILFSGWINTLGIEQFHAMAGQVRFTAIPAFIAALIGAAVAGGIWWFISFRNARLSLSGLLLGGAVMGLVDVVLTGATSGISLWPQTMTLNDFATSMGATFFELQLFLAVPAALVVGAVNVMKGGSAAVESTPTTLQAPQPSSQASKPRGSEAGDSDGGGLGAWIGTRIYEPHQTTKALIILALWAASYGALVYFLLRMNLGALLGAGINLSALAALSVALSLYGVFGFAVALALSARIVSAAIDTRAAVQAVLAASGPCVLSLAVVALLCLAGPTSSSAGGLTWVSTLCVLVLLLGHAASFIFIATNLRPQVSYRKSAIAILGALLIWFVPLAMVRLTSQISNIVGTMGPELQEGDYVFGVRNPFGDLEPGRGDIVLVSNQRGGMSIGRVIGLPGDRLEIDGTDLTINGKPVESRFVKGLKVRSKNGPAVIREYEETIAPGKTYKVWKGQMEHQDIRVPRARVYILQDVRIPGQRARTGFVPVKDIQAKVTNRIYSSKLKRLVWVGL